MTTIPRDCIKLSELIDLWTDKMPALRDQGEADRMNLLLGNILMSLAQRGKQVPPTVFVAAAPPDDDRAARIEGGDVIAPVFFTSIYQRYDKSAVFNAFWQSLTDEQKQAYWRELR